MTPREDQLRHELGATLPPSVAALSDADRARLAELLATARQRQARALAQAVDEGLGFVPRLARIAVKRALSL
jgi:hypothetical protein